MLALTAVETFLDGAVNRTFIALVVTVRGTVSLMDLSESIAD